MPQSRLSSAPRITLRLRIMLEALMKAWTALLFALAAGLSAGDAARAADGYLDDRSDATMLVRSLYNAIDRKEYARAYGYFAEPPAESVEAYAEGFADTEGVEVLTGAAAEEGAAGSVFTTLPVAIRATKSDGGETFFAGCYTTRLANPQVQAESFTPIMIEDGTLEQADGPLEAALPASCGDAPAAEPVDATLEQAKTRFEALYADTCPIEEDAGDDTTREPEDFTIPFSLAADDADEPEREARLFRFACGKENRNETHVYFLADGTGRAEPLHFATPELSIHYVDDDPQGEVDDMRIVGYTAEDRLANSRYDPDTLTIMANRTSDGGREPSTSGTWIFRYGTFTLVKYDVDPTHDGAANLQPMLDFYSGP